MMIAIIILKLNFCKIEYAEGLSCIIADAMLAQLNVTILLMSSNVLIM